MSAMQLMPQDTEIEESRQEAMSRPAMPQTMEGREHVARSYDREHSPFPLLAVMMSALIVILGVASYWILHRY